MQKRYNVPSNVPAQDPKQSTDILASEINKYIPEIRKALPAAYSAERMARILVTEVRKNPKLAMSDRASFFGALMQCAQLGLEPGSTLGHAWLIPRNKKGGGVETQLMIGYQGMIELAERDGRVTIVGRAVYANELFDVDYGTDDRIIHKPTIGKGTRGELIATYAIAKYKDGRSKFVALGLDEIDDAKKRSASPNVGPWATDYDAMAIKTAIRRLFKQLPKSPEMGKVIELEETAEQGKSQRLAELNPIEGIAIPAPEAEEEDVSAVHKAEELAFEFVNALEKANSEVMDLFKKATNKPFNMLNDEDLDLLKGMLNSLKEKKITWDELMENVAGS